MLPYVTFIQRGSGMYQPHFDAQRFRDLILYLAYRCQDAVYLVRRSCASCCTTRTSLHSLARASRSQERNIERQALRMMPREFDR